MDSICKQAREAEHPANADNCVEVEVDPKAHLAVFTKYQMAWASKHHLDLLGEVGLMLAAIGSWPAQHRLPVETETAFSRAHLVCTILHNEGLYASDLAQGKTQAISLFDADFQLHLKSAGLKPLELSRIINGLEVLGSAGGCSKKRNLTTCPENSIVSKRRRASVVVVDKLQQEFAADFISEQTFDHIQVCKLKKASARGTSISKR